MADREYENLNAIYRPATIAEVAAWSLQDNDFDRHVRDFLHEFAAHQHFSMLAEAPVLLRQHFGDEAVRDAYLAASAAYLARSIKREAPSWTMDDDRRAQRPWFASHRMDTLHTMLLIESPPEFRERNLFVSANALTVC